MRLLKRIGTVVLAILAGALGGMALAALLAWLDEIKKLEGEGGK